MRRTTAIAVAALAALASLDARAGAVDATAPYSAPLALISAW